MFFYWILYYHNKKNHSKKEKVMYEYSLIIVMHMLKNGRNIYLDVGLPH